MTTASLPTLPALLAPLNQALTPALKAGIANPEEGLDYTELFEVFETANPDRLEPATRLGTDVAEPAHDPQRPR